MPLDLMSAKPLDGEVLPPEVSTPAGTPADCVPAAELVPGDPVQVQSLLAPFGWARVEALVPAGPTVAELVAAAVGEALLPAHAVRVWLIGSDEHEIPAALWPRVRPKPGTRLAIRVVPRGGGGGGGKGILRMVLMLAVVAAAVASGQWYLSTLAEAAGGTAAAASTAAATTTAALTTGQIVTHALIVAGVGLVGSLAVNALVPPPKPSVEAPEQSFGVSAGVNRADKWGPVTLIVGRHKVYPRLGAQPETEIVGDDQYLRLLFVVGYGPLEIAELKLGDTPLTDYSDVELEVRQGLPDDAPVTLYRGTVYETQVGIVPRAADGWLTRDMDAEVEELAVDAAFPSGVWLSRRGDRKPHTAGLAVEWAPQGTEEWQAVGGIAPGAYIPPNPFEPGDPGELVLAPRGLFVTAETTKALRRTLRWPVPRGRYKVRVRRLVDNDDNTRKFADTVAWTALRGRRPDPAVTMPGLALVALRIRASGQINGTVSDLNCIATSILPDWDGSDWVERPTRNPAAHYLHLLRGRPNKRPLPDRRIDLAGLAAWHEACTAHGWTADGVFQDRQTLYARLQQIAAVGRAAPQIRDGLWGVVRDVPQAVPVQLFSPVNSWGFKSSKVFGPQPDLLKVRIVNPAADWEYDEVLVYADGKDAGNATVSEVLDLPLVTDAGLAWRHGRYHLAVGRLRPETHELYADIEALRCQRGDLIHVAHDVLLVGTGWGRIKAVPDRERLVLDTPIALEAGQTYGLRLRLADGAQHTNTLAAVAQTGEVTAIELLEQLPLATAPGDLVVIGPVQRETVPCLVKGVYPGPDLSARLVLVDAAPEVHAAETGPIPPHDPRVALRPLPAIAGLTLLETIVWERGVPLSRLSIDWAPLREAGVDTVQVAARAPDGSWQLLRPTRAAGVDIVPAAQGEWLVRVNAVAAAGRRGPVAEATHTLDGVADLDPPPGFTAAAVTTVLADGSVQPAIRCAWTVAATDPPLIDIVLRWRVRPAADADPDSLPWRQQTAPWGAGTAELVPVDQPLTYEVQAARQLSSGVRSDWTEVVAVVMQAGLQGARVAGLELFDEGPNNQFLGRDVSLRWRGAFPDSVPELGSEPFGAGTGSPSPYLQGYVLRVYDTDSGRLLRSEPPTLATDYVYGWEDNVADARRAGLSPRRRLRFVVALLPKVGGETGAAVMEVENPPPPTPVFTLTSPVGTRTVAVAIGRVQDLDHDGYRVWIADAPGIDPLTAEPTYAGPDPYLTWVAPDFGTYYVRVAAVDAFGLDGVVVAAEQQVVVGQVVPDATPPPIPLVPTLTGTLTQTEAGGEVVTLLASWASVDAADLSHYELEVREGQGNAVGATTASNAYQWPAKPNTAYAVRLRAVDTTGNASAYSPWATYTTPRDTQAPGAVTNLTAAAAIRTVFLAWDNPVDRDLAHVEIWQGTTADMAGAVRIGTPGAAPGQRGSFAVSALVTGVQRFYRVRAVDSSGNIGAWNAATGTPVTPSRTEYTDLAVGSVRADTVQAGAIEGYHLRIDTALPPQLTIGATGVTIDSVRQTAATANGVAATALSNAGAAQTTADAAAAVAADPAGRINANTTLIEPGRVRIAGTTSLSDWRGGPDQTSIRGGALENNSVVTNKLTVGNRALGFSGLDFRTAGNVVTWGPGHVDWVSDAGAPLRTTLTGGSASWTSGHVYLV